MCVWVSLFKDFLGEEYGTIIFEVINPFFFFSLSLSVFISVSIDYLYIYIRLSISMSVSIFSSLFVQIVGAGEVRAKVIFLPINFQ